MGSTLVPLLMKPIPSHSCTRLIPVSEIIVSFVTIPDTLIFRCDEYTSLNQIHCFSAPCYCDITVQLA